MKIFIVEDDPVIASAVAEHIASWGCETRIAQNFQNIVQEFVDFDPQLVLLDVGLPFYNGYHWCSEIRRFSSVPIIFVSSASDNMNIVMAINMGADDFIAKPFDLNVLTAKVQAMLRRTYDLGGQARLLQHRDAVLNTDDSIPHLSRGAGGADEERVPHFAGADGEQGQGRLARRADAAAVGDRTALWTRTR